MTIVSLGAFVLLAPSTGWAQPLQSFEDLALRVNLDDQLQIEDQSGAKVSGRVTHLTRGDLTIDTEGGEKRFTSDTVRAVAARGHPLRRGALVGAAVFAVLGAVAVCSHRGGANCAIVGPLGAAPIGAGVGLAVGALIPQMKPVYRVSESPDFIAPPRATTGVHGSLLEDLALRVNLDDRLDIEDRSGLRSTGRLTHLSDDELTIRTDAGEKQFARETVHRVALRQQRLRMGVLIGAGAGAATGALLACTGPTREECADAAILAGGLGAGLGLAAGALMHRTTIVYPDPEQRTRILPVIARDAVGVGVTRRW